jgi:ubiquinone/menaquinone biosynthesis C-methylase UbiE
MDRSLCRRLAVGVERERPATHHPAGAFAQADAATLPFVGEAFDAAVCHHGLEHFRQVERALAGMARVIRPGGFFFSAASLRSREGLHGGRRLRPLASSGRLNRNPQG